MSRALDVDVRLTLTHVVLPLLTTTATETAAGRG